MSLTLVHAAPNNGWMLTSQLSRSSCLRSSGDSAEICVPPFAYVVCLAGAKPQCHKFQGLSKSTEDQGCTDITRRDWPSFLCLRGIS